ncbi:hypothetical protein MO973_39550 [Paenibacillus sp. TRM 82003]|nr:hypothetical protein [Paenibacillus sp. TRM 82003]
MMPVLLYEDRGEFAKFMLSRLRESMEATLEQDPLDPLTLYLYADDPEGERSAVYLHNAYEEYRYYRDINAAVYYLNTLTKSHLHAKSAEASETTIRADKLVLALRTEEYIEALTRDGNQVIHFDAYPGLRAVLQESHDGFSAVVNRGMLERDGRWTEEGLFKRAVRNIRKLGWRNPSSMMLNDPLVGLVFEGKPYTNYQFLIREWAGAYLFPSYCIAFPNKNTSLVFPCEGSYVGREELQTAMDLEAIRKVVEQMYRMEPLPLCENLYWVNRGAATLLPREPR